MRLFALYGWQNGVGGLLNAAPLKVPSFGLRHDNRPNAFRLDSCTFSARDDPHF